MPIPFKLFQALCLSTAKLPQTLSNWKKVKQIEAISRIRNDFFDKLRDRKDTEIPQKQGVCLTEGFIADKGAEPFLAVRASKSKTIKTFMPS